jgi:hypothetical protein
VRREILESGVRTSCTQNGGVVAGGCYSVTLVPNIEDADCGRGLVVVSLTCHIMIEKFSQISQQHT